LLRCMHCVQRPQGCLSTGCQLSHRLRSASLDIHRPAATCARCAGHQAHPLRHQPPTLLHRAPGQGVFRAGQAVRVLSYSECCLHAACQDAFAAAVTSVMHCITNLPSYHHGIVCTKHVPCVYAAFPEWRQRHLTADEVSWFTAFAWFLIIALWSCMSTALAALHFAPVRSLAVYKLYRRGYTHERYRNIIHNIRRYMPDASISGDAIVGYPGGHSSCCQHEMNNC
jgi:hypothetical protein